MVQWASISQLWYGIQVAFGCGLGTNPRCFGPDSLGTKQTQEQEPAQDSSMIGIKLLASRVSELAGV